MAFRRKGLELMLQMNPSVSQIGGFRLIMFFYEKIPKSTLQVDNSPKLDICYVISQPDYTKSR